jgi:drug/metabolite transporter (DMT)-like permease
MTETDRILPGVALMLGFCIAAPLIDVFSKLAAQAVPVGMIVLGRGIVQAGLMLPVVIAMRQPLALARRDVGLTALRAAFLVASTYCFVAAVRVMPIADALAIAFVEPFVILLIGRFAMGEEVGPRRLAACAVGFLGSLLVIQPSFETFGPVALFPLGTAVSFALYMLVTRALSRRMHPVPLQFHTALLAALICIPLLALGTAAGEASTTFQLPQGVFWLWVFCVGLASAISHMAITYALKFAPSSTLAPLHYLEIVTATLFGYLVFGNFPNLLTLSGIAVIVTSGLYVIHRERVTARARRLTSREAVLAQR